MAADNGGTITSTIDTNKNGSLTINKYEGNEQDPDKLLDGVTFTAYKVADIVQSTEAGTTDVKMQPVKALTSIDPAIQITSETKYDEIKDTVEQALAEDADPKLTAFATAKTGDNGTKGQAVFNEMPVGVYLIVETDAPSQIVNKTANFLVSIPMVKEDRTGWDYDIVANPKKRGGLRRYQPEKVR